MHTVRPLTRGDTIAGIGFIVFFLGGVASSSPPDASASDAKWIANYTGSANNWGHVLTGIFLILAALSLATFMTGMWRRISSARPAGATSPLPLVAVGIASTLMAFGGILMAYVAGSELGGKYPLPSADLLRFSNGFGFIVTGIPGMAAVAFCIAVLAAQARIRRCLRAETGHLQLDRRRRLATELPVPADRRAVRLDHCLHDHRSPEHVGKCNHDRTSRGPTSAS